MPDTDGTSGYDICRNSHGQEPISAMMEISSVLSDMRETAIGGETVDDALGFIHRRFGPECDSRWTTGNCMWFATILKLRFPSSEIMYDSVRNHFLVLLHGKLIDWTGIVPDGAYDVVPWSDIIRDDPFLCRHVIRDCWA